MPVLRKPIEKLYYSIGEVSEKLSLNASLIRYWEKEFTIIKPRKNSKGDRIFTKADIEIIQKIYDLVKIQGLTLDGAKKALKIKPLEVSTPHRETPTHQKSSSEMIDRLNNLRHFLLELKESL
jgi:DNA-binding transcriptional MerR regulator